MAAQQTLKASLMQGCRSSDVSAMAIEGKKTIAATAHRSVFTIVQAFKTGPLSRTRGARAVLKMEAVSVAVVALRYG